MLSQQLPYQPQDSPRLQVEAGKKVDVKKPLQLCLYSRERSRVRAAKTVTRVKMK